MLRKANQDENVKFIVISGKGGNFSSGNDLSNFTDP
jgi:enoyl-CoA hydratase/carnithine racemase